MRDDDLRRATDTAPEFDLGPLSWVQGEIDQALARGLESLAAFRATPADPTALKHARTHVHQAAGAIQMVGLDAVVAFTDEIERQLARLEELPPRRGRRPACAVDRSRVPEARGSSSTNWSTARRRCRSSSSPNTRRCSARAASRPPRRPTCSIPDLSPRAPQLGAARGDRADEAAVVPGQAAPALPARPARVAARRRRRRARRCATRSPGIEDASRRRAACARSGGPSARCSTRIVEQRARAAASASKQLAARIDLQIRRVVEGSAKVADRLRREVLYYVAISAPVAPQVQAVQRAFKLVGPDPVGRGAERRPRAPAAAAARGARAARRGARTPGSRSRSGRAENLPKLKQTLASVHAQGRRDRQRRADEAHRGAGRAARQDAAVGRVRAAGDGVRDGAAARRERVRELRAACRRDFPKQVDAMLARLDAARAGAPDRRRRGGADARRDVQARAGARAARAGRAARSRRTCGTWSRCSTRSSATHGKRAELATLGKDSQQIRGALRMLGLDDAERLLGLCQEQIDTYANPDTPVGDDDLELLAESLSGLGFYIEAVEQQRPDRERLIAPLLAQAPGRGAAPAQDDRAPRRSRPRSRNCAARCRRSSPKSAARRRMPRRARDADARSSTDCATTPS